MALYHHVPNKEALLDGVIEEVATEVPVPRFTAAGWQKGLRRYALALLDAVAAHPNLVPLALSRPAITPRNLDTMEKLLRSLKPAGFRPQQALDLVWALNGLILVHVPLLASAEDDTVSVLAADTYPLLAEATRANAKRRATARFEAALDALLTGFAAKAKPADPDR